MTKKDAALVTKVLLELGYLPEEETAKRKNGPARPAGGLKKT
ncbi:MAG TPA: hypothetical protein VF173_21480 [Thermoanaerobaculia bacterium]|nr:hypothetical protein [Thermoanaerobaculia bacterium]